MFNHLIIFGCGAITYLMAEKCSKKVSPNWYTALITYIMCSMINMAAAYLLLSPMGRITRINTLEGITEISYGNLSIILAIIIALFLGVVLGFLKKNVDIRTEIKNK